MVSFFKKMFRGRPEPSAEENLHAEVARRKQVETELRRERERLQLTLSSIGDAVIVTDADGCVTFLNPVAQRLTGWSREDAVGKPLATVFRIHNEQTGQVLE